MFSAEEQKLRETICQVAQIMYGREMLGGPAGNISLRLDDETFLLTPSRPFKQLLTPEDILRLNADGEKIGPHTEANKDYNPTSEVPMHLAYYSVRPDVRGLVHGHPRYCVGLSAAGKKIKPELMTESILFLGHVGVAEYAMPTSVELGEAVAEVAAECDCVVLPSHGVIVGGKDIWDAISRLEVLELAAMITHDVELLGGAERMPKHHLEDLLKLRAKLGMARESDKKLLD